jgi:type VI secretion system protein ImpC
MMRNSGKLNQRPIMARRSSSSSVQLDVDAGRSQVLTETEAFPPKAELDDPFRILILGDFSGRDSGGRKAIAVNRDNLDQVLRALGVRLDLRLGSGAAEPLSLGFDELEDFEPDRIFQRCDLFRKLSERPASSTQAPSQPARAPARSPDADVARLTSGSLLDEIVGHSETGAGATPSRRRDEFQEVVERIVAPHLTPPEDPQAVRAAADSQQRMSLLMRAILHHPDFQALESVWRALDLVVRRLESDELLKLYILDISKAEIAADLARFDAARPRDLRATELYRTLVEQTVETPGGEAWAVIAGNYGFDRSASDVELLAKLGLIARAAGAPFIAESVPSRDENAADHRAWQAFRRAPQAQWVGLAMPRFLLRLPYGKNAYAIDSFEFEEMPGRPEHLQYLWGNPAFACVYLLGNSFTEHGWGFRPGMIQQIDGLPLHTYQADGEAHAQPCAEVLLTDRDAELILDEGLMPLASIKNSDSVRLVRFQSVADPLAPLAGRWGEN